MASSTSIGQSPPQTQPLRLIQFGRVSSKRQLQKTGPARQSDWEIPQWLESHSAVIVQDWGVFAESATTLDRPKFEQALKEAIRWKREGRADGIVMASVDRLSRLPYDGAGALRDALRAGMHVVFAASDLDASREADMARILDQLSGAWSYAKRLGAQAAYAREARRKAGKMPIGSVAWHLHYSKALGRPDSVIKDRGDRIRAAALAVIGGKSLRALEAEFNASGVPAPLGSRWWHSTLREMLRSEALKGVFLTGKTKSVRPEPFEPSKRQKREPTVLFEDKRLAVLTDGEWELLQAALTRNAINSPRNLQHDYPPIRGHLRCAVCDRAFEVNSGKRNLGFRCPKCRTYLAAWSLWRNKVQKGLTLLFTQERFLERTAKSELVRGQTLDGLRAQLAEKRQALAGVEEQTKRAMRLAIALPGHEADVQREIKGLDARKSTLVKETAEMEAKVSLLGQRDAAADIVGRYVAIMRGQVLDATAEQWRVILNSLSVVVWVTPEKTLTYDLVFPMGEKSGEPSYTMSDNRQVASFYLDGRVVVGDPRVVPAGAESEVVDKLSSRPPTR